MYVPAAFRPDDDAVRALLGHLARNNEHWQQEVLGEALVIVRGPDAYVTPSWYASKREHGRVVPTWNYVTAHATASSSCTTTRTGATASYGG